MSEYKLVPFEPTPKMVEAAEEAHMPFGDMDLAIRMAVLAAPDSQVEPTDNELLEWAGEEQFFLFCDEDEFLQIARSVIHKYGRRGADVKVEPVAIVCDFSEGSGPQPTFVEAEVGGKSVSFEWRDRPDGLKEMLVPQSVTPNIVQLVEALELIAKSCDVGRHDGLPEDGPALCATEAWLIAKDVLAAYRKGGEV